MIKNCLCMSHNVNNSALTCISLARSLRQKSVGWDRNFVHGWSDTIATAPPDGKRRSTNKETTVAKQGYRNMNDKVPPCNNRSSPCVIVGRQAALLPANNEPRCINNYAMPLQPLINYRAADRTQYSLSSHAI